MIKTFGQLLADNYVYFFDCATFKSDMTSVSVFKYKDMLNADSVVQKIFLPDNYMIVATDLPTLLRAIQKYVEDKKNETSNTISRLVREKERIQKEINDQTELLGTYHDCEMMVYDCVDKMICSVDIFIEAYNMCEQKLKVEDCVVKFIVRAIYTKDKKIDVFGTIQNIKNAEKIGDSDMTRRLVLALQDKEKDGYEIFFLTELNGQQYWMTMLRETFSKFKLESIGRI